MADLKNNSEVLNDIRKIIEQGRHQAYAAAGQAAIATYWGIGRRIVEEEQHGDERAKYGTHLITELAAKLIPIFGNNYSKRNLQHYRKFYILFPDYSKVYEFVHNLNWTHIRRLLSVVNPEARMWYLKMPLKRCGVRQLSIVIFRLNTSSVVWLHNAQIQI